MLVVHESWGERYASGVGTARTSLVGFGDGMNQALLAVALRCGVLCGTSYLVVATRTSDRQWTIAQVLTTGAS
jgi:hypothetical protein